MESHGAVPSLLGRVPEPSSPGGTLAGTPSVPSSVPAPHSLVPLQHQHELSALGRHSHLCPGRCRHLQGKEGTGLGKIQNLLEPEPCSAPSSRDMPASPPRAAAPAAPLPQGKVISLNSQPRRDYTEFTQRFRAEAANPSSAGSLGPRENQDGTQDEEQHQEHPEQGSVCSIPPRLCPTGGLIHGKGPQPWEGW